MESILVVIVTGHPATGKTTLADQLAGELGLPLLAKDHIKETLLNTLGWSTDEWSRKLGVATWALLYRQVETLLQTGVAHIVEANFDPAYADTRWQELADRYPLQVVQVRCETAPETLLARYRARIQAGSRHPGHVDDAENAAFQSAIRQGPVGWVAVDGERISVDTTDLTLDDYAAVARQIKQELFS
ncbi:MAG: ATP-binding protein [Anaerolineales bacterium]|nr:ATP-binding protein [Anaerolineales bacterium]